MFKLIVKVMDGSVERWEGIPFSMVQHLQHSYSHRGDIFCISVLPM